MDKPKFYLTTPIYYANSRPHVGSAYTTIVCDVIARYKRMCGYEVAYLTGTDEHGVNIERAAEKQGITPAELVDRNQKIFLELWKLLGISYTDFVRTTSPHHAIAVQTLIRRTQRLSPEAIYKRKYEGRYCIYDNLYVSDTPEPADCQICGRPAELISEENYFFRLSSYQDKLLQLYKDNPQFVQPDFRLNEVKSFVESGLKDLSISRKSIKWGIPWPGDPEHVFYVWYDALSSYMSGIGFVNGESKDSEAQNPENVSRQSPAASSESEASRQGTASAVPNNSGRSGVSTPEDSLKFQKFWPADVHMIGKEIIRFHAVYWPAFLMAAGLPLPKQIFAHGWLLFEQEKMSKSKGNVAYPEPIVNVLGNDALRYYLLRETVFGQDGNFSREALLTNYNAYLANGLGNLVSRTLTMIDNYFKGAIPDPKGLYDPRMKEIANLISGDDIKLAGARGYFNDFDFSRAIESIWAIVSFVDSRFTTIQPWVLAKDEGKRATLAEILYSAAEALRFISVLAHPVIPDATQKIWEQLGQNGRVGDVRIDKLEWGGLNPGTKIGKPEAVFPRVDKKEASEKIEAMENEIRNPSTTPPAAEVPAKVEGSLAASHSPLATGSTPAADAKISIDDFAKVELRVGLVKSAERIQGADRLLKIMVDIGDEVRQVLAGIALSYAPEDLVGRKVVVVTNLAPRKMRGQESNGMLLAASAGPDGKPVLCTFAEDISPGAKVR
jgi:methionyl-tRNA synthetase